MVHLTRHRRAPAGDGVVHLYAVAETADGLRGYDMELLPAADAANDGLRAHAQRVAEAKLRAAGVRARHPVLAVTFAWEGTAGDDMARARAG